MSIPRKGRKVVLEVKRMSEQIQWTDTPSHEDHVPRFDIEIVKPHIPIKAVFINPWIDGFNSHFDIDLKATIPCLDAPHCAYCQRRVRQRWDGFAFVMSPRRRLFILRVSEGLRRQLINKTDIKKLRGIQFIVKRTGPHKNSPLDVELGHVQKCSELPDPQNIRATVARALGLDRERKLTVEFHEDRGEVQFHDFTSQIPTE